MDALNGNGVTPTSADACMSIVHSLMCHRQGGESEQFSKRAVESLVKKLKEKREDLDHLIMAITTNGTRTTKCVTIPRTLDGRLQIAGRKCFPHVIYCKIWRWPDLHKNELRKADECLFAFELKVDLVCVNPYHYIRDVSLGVDLAALTMHNQQQQQQQQQQQMYHHAENADWINQQQNQTWNYDYGYLQQQQHPQQQHELLHNEISYHPQSSGWHLQVPRKSTVLYDNNEATKAEESWTPDQQRRRSTDPIQSPIQQPFNHEPISRQPPPENWCSITYHELDVQVGEPFKATNDFIAVDGYFEQNDKSRFCVGALSNVQRKEVSETTRLYIGKGVTLELEGEGDVYLHCLSRHAVFIESQYLDWKNKRTDVVHKFCPGVREKVFDLRQCTQRMQERIQNVNETVTNNVINGGHLAPALSHASAASGFGIDDLRKLCMFRFSFVKGYGKDEKYKNRNTITETPCWIQVQLHRGLQVLDELLKAKTP